MTDYQLLNNQLNALSEGISYDMTILSNASALINEAMDNINWCGFYILKNNVLLLGPFQGKVACTKIPVGKGVCGTSAELDSTIVVSDVHEFPGHIACDSASNSEIVIPIHKNGKLYGVLDIDSPILNRFSEDDKLGLESFVNTLENSLSILA